jgi:hypothetical protein
MAAKLTHRIGEIAPAAWSYCYADDASQQYLAKH